MSHIHTLAIVWIFSEKCFRLILGTGMFQEGERGSDETIFLEAEEETNALKLFFLL